MARVVLADVLLARPITVVCTAMRPIIPINALSCVTKPLIQPT